jgi:hypothetical protein
VVPVVIAGAICVAFAPILLLASRKRELGSGEIALLIAVDGAWVIASVVVIAVAPITAIGCGLIVAQAALVGVFIALESAGLKRLVPAARAQSQA